MPDSKTNERPKIPARSLCQLLLWLASFMTIETLLAASVTAKLPFDPYIAANADDATLHAIYAATPDHVWTVGDRGIIWATTNGGRNWKKQDSSTTANLHAVIFRDANEGCAVGGIVGAHTRLSRGVVLRTKNGGEKWEEVQTDSLPRLVGMRLVGSRILAWGDYCPQRKTGIFTSHDFGMTWQALPSSIVHVAALGADASGNILAVDRVGNLFNSKHGPLRSTYMTRPDQAIEFIEHLGSVWLAGGADGQLMRSVDGESWSRIKLPLSPSAQKACHWRSAFRWEDHLWIVGTPGSIVAYSPNRGVTWEILGTDQRLPLQAQFFADSQRGWSVGALGQILATRDGGKTWYPQRATAERSGLMSVVAQEQQVPWPALVAASWDEMVSSSSVSLFAKHLEQSADYVVEDWKFHECIAPQMGIADHRGWLANASNAASNSSELAELSDRLTVELLSWRPDVLLTSETADCTATENRAAMAIVVAAMQQAADATPQSFARELRLSPWQVTKLATVTDSRTSQFTEQPNRLMRETGLTIWDAMSPMAVPYSAIAPALPMRTLQQVQSMQANNSALFGGIAPSKDSKRQVQARALGNYQLIMGRVHRMTSIDGLATMAPETPLAEWQTQFDFVIRTLPPRELVTSIHRITQAARHHCFGHAKRLPFSGSFNCNPKAMQPARRELN